MFVMVVAEFRQTLYLQLGETPARFVYRLGPARSAASLLHHHRPLIQNLQKPIRCFIKHYLSIYIICKINEKCNHRP